MACITNMHKLERQKEANTALEAMMYWVPGRRLHITICFVLYVTFISCRRNMTCLMGLFYRLNEQHA